MTNRKLYVSWKYLPWRKFRENLFLTQQKIFKCIKYKNFKKALLTQSVLLSNYQLYYLAIRKITQLRLDRKIPGIDKKLITSSFARKELIISLKKKIYAWKYKALYKIYLLDFIRGKTLVFVPTVFDRIIQYIWSLILEPVFNSLFFENVTQLSSFQNCLYAKYSIILNLMSALGFKIINIFHIKLHSFSSFLFTFDKNYILKTFLFPDEYKKLLIQSFKFNSFWNLMSNNKDLKCYLYLFDYYIISFAFAGLDSLFFNSLSSKLANYYNEVRFNFQYFNESIYLLDQIQTEKFLFLFSNKFTFDFCTLFGVDVLFLKTDNFLNIFTFLDWNFIVLNCNCKILPSYESWLEYKSLFKQILKNTRYSLYQRVTFLIILAKKRFRENWFCEALFLRRETYFLKLWFHNYVKKNTNFSKYQRVYISQQIFKHHTYKAFFNS